MSSSQTTIYIVDDDNAVRDSLRFLLETNGYIVETFPSGELFLDSYKPDSVSILITDVRMPGMSGLQLQEEMNNRKIDIPIVFITGHGTVPMAVSTMQRGAVDFIEKPFNLTHIQEVISRLINVAQDRAEKTKSQKANDALLGKLTSREQQVLERIVAGRLNKQIADDLSISIKTVEAHRANIMEKLEVSNVADLIKVALKSSNIPK
ncbi:response regulator transcription factor [Taylorella equigenitalis]|uniref:Two-component response regulator n=3 Tax=Taylorella equigenitalis TaxID=29575 RepID=A0A654KIV7_TAYEM|nr:response regulator transcription factor [Taylorella equigenitalis]ADU92299.1 two-component response regulator [Taylorella equigenitalis MCE9]AFN35853.1 response regulator [Taylorella equigenitalis ATCC 35865]ASY30493.1 DNA-binding response regulator [Taylorella equigenitalis]ASY37800.1 DNA-binding response regulator [Taylorella equigenitalis]ASY39268.1 DNA-binding response regulator [Taylorella equigenitalis]